MMRLVGKDFKIPIVNNLKYLKGKHKLVRNLMYSEEPLNF